MMEKRMAAPRACPPSFCPDPNGEIVVQIFFTLNMYFKVDQYKNSDCLLI